MKKKYILIGIVIALTYTLLLYPFVSEAHSELPSNTLNLTIDHDNNQITGKSVITIPPKRGIVLDLGFLHITSLSYNNSPLKGKDNKRHIRFEGSNEESIIEINYELSADTMGTKGVMSSSQGMFFTDGWYPHTQGLALYNLSVSVPEGFEAISEAQEIISSKDRDKKCFNFIFNHPLNSLSLVVGKYMVFKDNQKDIELYAYFFEDDKTLAHMYFNLLKKYLSHYEEFFGKYPYKRFSVVENFLPTGYAMPTYTLLGQNVMRLPHYVVESFLSHEILHQWFGCSVYVKYNKGNWSEGLVSFLADYYQYDTSGQSTHYRKEALISSYYNIPDNESMSLRKFRTRKDRKTQAIGYDRAMMFFYMLRSRIGNDIFFRSLRRIAQEKQFQKLSWTDLQKVFEEESEKELEQFFKQWTHVKKLPELSIEDIYVIEEKEGPAISFRIKQKQKGKPLTFNLPLRVKTKSDDVIQSLLINKKSNDFNISLPAMAEEIIIDEEYSLLRKLHPDEVNPVIAGLLGDENKTILVPQETDIYEDLIRICKERDFKYIPEKDFKYDEIKDSSFLMLGFDNPVIKKLIGKVKAPEGDFVLKVFENPLNPKKVIVVVEAKSQQAVKTAAKRIFHYDNYSLLRFEKGKVIEKSISPAQNGIREIIMKPEMAVELSSTYDLDHVVDKVAHKKIIYIGETHDRYEHHITQLRIIKELHRKGIKLAIGMEMFINDQQDALDKFINGEIDEKEFLSLSHYFEHWNMNYHLYRGIIEFARAHRIPVIGLNIDEKIVKKISSSGMSSLTESEKQKLPEYIDLTDYEYKKKLKMPFEMHEGFENKDFDDFFQAQVLRDETMAYNMARFLSQNPSYTMVVIAGVGHIAYGSGIPQRAYKLSELSSALIINASGTDIEKESADFVIYSSPLEAPQSPKLMVMIKEENGIVEIVDFPENSVSETAGLKKGDIIRTLDGTAISDTNDIRVFLFFKKKGDTVTVKVKRKIFLIEEEELDFNVTL
jgi:aminopeptidase N